MKKSQMNFLNDEKKAETAVPVECLGLTFPNDEARRKHFFDLLREKLKDAEFRKIEGFPIGTDEDILALSDPPYYTACPNPWVNDFIKHFGKPYDSNDTYNREPFAADVSEGKNDPIYNVHSYHTKVPHKAIMRYILHYTEPGDIVFDGFCGTGMTGVAAQLCGDRETVESLGYRVDETGIISQQEVDETGKATWKPFSKIGARKAVLNDLSPAATFIAYNYNTPVDVQEFEREAKRILQEVEEECGWMYETLHVEEKAGWKPALRGKINSTVWSDVFICPTCAKEVVFWEAAVDKEAGSVKEEFPCPHCASMLTKRRMEHAWVTRYDRALGQTIRQAKRIPVLINYSVEKKRYEKTPDAFDLALIEKIEQMDIPYWFPTNPIPKGDMTGQPLRIGITHVHHFYTKRNLWVLGAIRKLITNFSFFKFLFTASVIRLGITARYKFKGGIGPLTGTLYVCSLPTETNVIHSFLVKMKQIIRNELILRNFINNSSSTCLCVNGEVFDYIFTDPPFGGNLMYSELNFLWEAWLKVFTNNKSEAIENKTQGKGLPEYQKLMTECFKENFRILKPGRWMTVEFHSSQKAVWNAIQQALQTAGFVIADVRTLDKQQGTFNQVSQAGAVKQDIIISCYKPDRTLEECFKLEAGTEAGVWDFVRAHLRQLPIVVKKLDTLKIGAERQNYLLFDRMVSFHVLRGVMVPVSACEFYEGLIQRFSERDGMYFLPEQVAEYDKKRMTMREVLQLQLFV